MKKNSRDEIFARIAKSVADPRRYEILQKIAAAPELACSDLKEELPITAATLSHHLKELADAGLIETRKSGKCVHMKLRRATWKKYLDSLHKL